MNASWEGCTKLIEAQDKRIAELRAQVERLNRQLDYSLKTGDERWMKEHARLNDLWGAADGEYVCIPEFNASEAFATLREAEENAAYYQRQHERCAIIKMISIAEINDEYDEDDDYEDPKADKIMYNESWRDAV